MIWIIGLLASLWTYDKTQMLSEKQTKEIIKEFYEKDNKLINSLICKSWKNKRLRGITELAKIKLIVELNKRAKKTSRYADHKDIIILGQEYKVFYDSKDWNIWIEELKDRWK